MLVSDRGSFARLVWAAVLFVTLGACGGEDQKSPALAAPSSSPATAIPARAPTISLTLSYTAHRFGTTDLVPSWTYAGETYPAGVADIFPQASVSVDFQQDRRPELVVPLNKAYGTPAYAALPYLLLSNPSGRLEYDPAANARLPSVFGARRASVISYRGAPAAFFVAHNVSGYYNNPNAHGTAFLLGSSNGQVSRISNALPRLTTRETLPDDGVDAHSMATGDINGDGLDDLLIGNWEAFGGGFPPVFLFQQADGQFAASRDPFLGKLLSMPMTNPRTPANEGFNLLLDLHLADVNGDRLADLVAGFGHGSTPSFLFLNQNGTFDFERRIALPPTVYGIDTNLHLRTWSADIDNDGDLDLLINHSRYVPYYGGSYTQILRNDKGMFADVTSAAIVQNDADIRGARLTWSDNLYLKDMDANGLIDIIFGQQDGRIQVYLNRGGDKFDLIETRLPSGEAGRLLAVDDFDGDGSTEMVFYQYGGSPTEKVYFINVYKAIYQ